MSCSLSLRAAGDNTIEVADALHNATIVIYAHEKWYLTC